MPVSKLNYFSMYRVMDEYDMKEALLACIHKHIGREKISANEFCRRGNKAVNYIRAMMNHEKLKPNTYEEVSTWTPLVFKVTIKSRSYKFYSFYKMTAFVADKIAAKRKRQRHSLARYRDAIGSDYDHFERQYRIYQPTLFKCIEHLGYKLYLGLKEPDKVESINTECNKVEAPAPSVQPVRGGNGKVVNSFQGW